MNPDDPSSPDADCVLPEHSSPAAGDASAVEPRLLLVEDHQDSANMIAKILRRSGYIVTMADSVAAAMRHAAGEEFDAVVCDIGLPDGTGLDLMRELRAKHELRGIALSGFGMEEDIIRSREAGFAEHLVKPINIEQLEAALRRLLGSPDAYGK